MFQIKSGAGKRHPATKNNPHPVEKTSRKIPEWLSFTRKVEKEVKDAEQKAREKKGSQVKPKKKGD